MSMTTVMCLTYIRHTVILIITMPTTICGDTPDIGMDITIQTGIGTTTIVTTIITIISVTITIISVIITIMDTITIHTTIPTFRLVQA